MAPALVLFCLMVLAPIVIAAYDSFFKWNGFGGHPTDFIGFDNFRRLFKDPVFLDDLKHGGILIVLSLVIQLPLSLGLAMLLNQKLRGRAVYRLLFFAPYVLSEVITAVLFNLIFAPEIGLADYLFDVFGINTDTAWLGDPNIVLYLLFFVITWKYFGFHMILYLAARQGIPHELHEAAATEGRPPGRSSARSRCRCSARRSGSASSCRSSAPCSCSTWSGYSRAVGRSTRPRPWP
ncbi:carbohydrate ABC transporter permease [Luedemannella flava]